MKFIISYLSRVLRATLCGVLRARGGRPAGCGPAGRALAVLLLLVLGAGASPPALLVLRAACATPLRRLFAAPELAALPLRLVPYEECCGAGWEAAVRRASLAALSEGGAVLAVGWPGPELCAVLEAVRRPAPAPCAAGHARAALVLELARRARWHRALVSRAAPGPHCAHTLRGVARALSAAGLDVRRADLSPHELARRPHVVIQCASRHGHGAQAESAPAGAAPALLLLHVDESAPLARLQSRSGADEQINDAFNLSNITLAISDSLNSQYNVRDNSTSDHEARGGEGGAPPSIEPSAEALNEPVQIDTKIEFVRLRSNPRERTNLAKRLHSNEYRNENGRAGHPGARAPRADNASPPESASPVPPARRLQSIDEFVAPHLVSFFQRKLLLADENYGRELANKNDVLDQIVEAIRSDSQATRSRRERHHHAFVLYEWTGGGAGAWSRVSELAAEMSRALEAPDDWEVTVHWANVTVAPDGWAATPPREDERGDGAAVTATVAGAALGVGGAVALLVRWVATRRRRRRRREGVALSPADFTFPVEERRRVGEGMETMLSCWLQQLHEFGAPEPQRADLTPCVPLSAPSSTCSVNRLGADRRVRYKGEVVHVKQLAGPGDGAGGPLALGRKATDVLLVMQSLRHENLNTFIGCLCEARGALVFERGARGSLEEVLQADDIRLDWTFRLSLLTDLVRGMRYLHGSALRAHGRLSSRNCVVDSRWVLRVTDYGLPALRRALDLVPPPRTTRDLLWTAPELLRGEARGEAGGTQPGDVFSFAIIMQEVIVRGEPYCMLALTPDEIVEKLSRPPPLIRPSVSMGAAPPDAVSVMRQCWSEAPELRPDFARLCDVFRQLHRGRKTNIVDSMFEMLEKYSNNLEELVRERTEQLDMEKKKTEQLLNRMLPRSVAERLLLGSRVEPEEFEEVSIYFSDIVGFTALAARSTPVQVVDLLNDLYTTFDAAIEQYRVYKVETIGDAYMVVGGLPVRARDHAESVATMALHLLHLAGRFRARHLPAAPLHLRIGLHSGPVCAAVVGLTMPRYCLFGDTVNTASRMESTGAASRIQLSAATAARLAAAGGYRLRSRGLTQVKGKGAMHTYWLLGKDGFDKPLPTPPPLGSVEVLFEVDGENDSEMCSAPASSPPPSAPSANESPYDELQNSAPSTPPDQQGLFFTGYTNMQASHASVAPPEEAATSHAPHTRYRCLGEARRPLRRQWSLERGDSLAGAGEARVASAPPSPPDAPRASAGSAARYRTRPSRDLSAPAPVP